MGLSIVQLFWLKRPNIRAEQAKFVSVAADTGTNWFKFSSEVDALSFAKGVRMLAGVETA